MLTERYRFRYWVPALLVAACILALHHQRAKPNALADRPLRKISPATQIREISSEEPGLFWTAERLERAPLESKLENASPGLIQPVAEVRVADTTTQPFTNRNQQELNLVAQAPTPPQAFVPTRSVLEMASQSTLPVVNNSVESYSTPARGTNAELPLRDLSPTIPQPGIRALIDRSGNDESMAQVNELALRHVRNGFALGDRNAVYSARREFHAALLGIGRAIDARNGLAPNDNASSSQALSRALQALREVDDFSPEGSLLHADLDLERIIAAHRTPVCKTVLPVSQTAASQIYFNYGCEQLIWAVGNNRIASHALAGLGKCCALENTSSAPVLHAAKAMAYYHAAIEVDAGNHLAANELGVLLGKMGAWSEAKRMLLAAVRADADPATWRNLAIAHQQLGEQDLAHLAFAESSRSSLRGPANVVPGVASAPTVQWVDPHSFHGSPEDSPRVVQQTAKALLRTPASNETKTWWMPWR